MYYIINGMGNKYKPLAIFFSISGILVAIFGIGTFTQVNSITDSINGSFGVSPIITGIILTILVSTLIFNGIDSISKVASKVVPSMDFVYLYVSFL